MHVTAHLYKQLQTIVGEHRVHTESSVLQQYGVDRTTLWQPAPMAVVFPESVDQVQQIVLLANQHNISIVPSGGRTGLSGGAVAAKGELIVALDKMNRVLELNLTNRTISCEAGVITHTVQEEAQKEGLFYPVNFASSGSSQIGGNIATNAGGINVIRYGMTRDWVRGLTVVTGSGEILNLNQGLIKNNSGYDFRHLFTGSEGTLGIICEATLALTSPPNNPNVLLLSIASVNAIPQVHALFNNNAPLMACEFFSEKALKKVLAQGNMETPFTAPSPYYLLLEYEQTTDAVEENILQLFDQASKSGWVLDGVLSKNQTQAKQLWQLRESISETLAVFQPYKNDISVNPDHLPAFIEEVDQLIHAEHPAFEVIWFGHAGDGNMHLNIVKPAEIATQNFIANCQALSLLIAEKVHQFGGSISAEHGVGLLKKGYLHVTRSEQEITLMRQIKKAFDPNGVMNPGKLFD